MRLQKIWDWGDRMGMAESWKEAAHPSLGCA